MVKMDEWFIQQTWEWERGHPAHMTAAYYSWFSDIYWWDSRWMSKYLRLYIYFTWQVCRDLQIWTLHRCKHGQQHFYGHCTYQHQLLLIQPPSLLCLAAYLQQMLLGEHRLLNLQNLMHQWFYRVDNLEKLADHHWQLQFLHCYCCCCWSMWNEFSKWMNIGWLLYWSST